LNIARSSWQLTGIAQRPGPRLLDRDRVHPPPLVRAGKRLSDELHVLSIFHIAWTIDDLPVEVTIHVLPPHQWELHYEWPAEPGRARQLNDELHRDSS
jgi:hypothetical protein